MKTKFFAISVLAGLPVLCVGCSDSNTACSESNLVPCTYVEYDAGGPTDGGSNLTPPLPFVGQQLDRVGRPGIGKLLLNPFGLVAGRPLAQIQDAYNAASSPTDIQNGWPAFAAPIAQNLAAWDGINDPPTTSCGDQALAATGAVTLTRYQQLAAIMTADYLNVDTTQKTCNVYLGVELSAPNDCGGRSPSLPVSVVNTTLNILQGGVLTTAGGMTNPLTTGVNSDPDGSPSVTFPFFQGPS